MQRAKIALVFGGSRGIGAKICETLSKDYTVVVLAKTSLSDPQSKLPGTIEEVAAKCGGMAIKCNVAIDSDIKNAVDLILKTFSKIDVVVYNAGAILWEPVLKTPLKRYDLMHNVNQRGLYAVIQNILPVFTHQDSGRFVVVAPPIYSRFFQGKTPYAMTKIAMSVLCVGLSTELPPSIAITCLWPATGIKSFVTTVKGIPDEVLRKPDIFADCIVEILKSDVMLVNGKCLIDEDFLRSRGFTEFAKYRCYPEKEPPRMMPVKFPDLTVQEEAKL